MIDQEAKVKKRKGESSMFWGSIFLIIGLVVILNAVFGVDIPIGRILIGFFLIYLGLKVVSGGAFMSHLHFHSDRFNRNGQIVFGDTSLQPKTLDDLAHRSFQVIFGHGDLDLTNTKIEDGEKLTINTVFGDARVYVPENLALKPEVNSFVGSTRLPSAPTLENQKDGMTTLTLDINTVFGSTRIERRAAKPE